MAGKKRSSATLRDVAEEARVSQATVSMSLSGKGNVSEETRLKVLEAAKDLGYRGTSNQKASAIQQLLSIGLVIDISASTNHNWRNLRAYIEQCQNTIVERGGTFMVIPYNHRISEMENIRCVTKANIRGLISFSFYSESYFSNITGMGIPVVVFNNPQAHNRFVNVALDDFQSTYEAVKYLIDLGHRKIAFAYTERHNLPDLSNNRFFAYQKALEDSSIPFDEDLIVHVDVNSYNDNIHVIQSLMKRSHPPTAALCLDDDLAAGLHYGLKELGYAVPGDMSLIAHGDLLDYSRFQTPRINTLRMDPTTSSKLAVEMLIELLKKPDMTIQTIRVQEQLRDRGSCGPPGPKPHPRLGHDTIVTAS